MLKRNKHEGRHTVPHFTGLLSDLEHDAYQATLSAVQLELTDMATIAEAMRHLETGKEALSQAATSQSEVVVGPNGEHWRVCRRLLKLNRSEVLLCRKDNDMAVIERFPEESAYARANGNTEIVVTSNNEQILLQNFAQNERQALRLMTADLQEKVNNMLAERYPGRDLKRVAQAFSRRCNHELAVAQGESQPAAAPRRSSRTMQI